MEKFKGIMQKKGGRLFWIDRKAYDAWLSKLPDGFYETTIDKAIRGKSRNQLAAHFGLLLKDAIAQANDMGMDSSTFIKSILREDLPTGIGLTENLLKEIFYCACPILREDGRRITLSRASTQEAAKHFEDCRNLLASRGIFVRAPDVNWKEK